ncbi:MAG: hypothetical protein A2Y14_01485 [Verrucomicrobia bacterium GWF2_51_19]|nr:MAG: hypothetical protein A2Y14_01485 [Verrucomicrobia bacterium GWF2_51_19]HCJ12550.1 hypothetical protein [Opitutae bacterium]
MLVEIRTFMEMQNKNTVFQKALFLWPWLVFVLFVFVGPVGELRQIWKQVDAQEVPASSGWGATNIWLTSAECMRKTGAWLCTGENRQALTPFRNADDPGHAFALGLYSRITQKVLTLRHVTKLNAVINFTGLLCIATVLFALRAYVSSFILLLSASIFLQSLNTNSSRLNFSPHDSYIGTALLASLLPIILWLGYKRGRFSKIGLCVGLLGLSAAAMIRQPIGIMGFMVSITVLAVVALQKQQRNKRALLRNLGLAFLIFFAWQTQRWVTLTRDVVFHIDSSKMHQGHGISHNLYIGLGAVENSLGIKWADSSGNADAKKDDATIAYCTPAYFSKLWQLYFRHWREHPLEIMRIYALKTRALLNTKFAVMRPPLFVFLLISLALYCLARRYKLLERYAFQSLEPIYVMAFVFIFFFIVQGVLSHHSLQYAAPINAFITMQLSLIGDFFIRNRYTKSS